ncbi:MgtC/SapB family protein [Natranaerofaba carboxydovora]|uniref:MgtC/SapB family protein n=1 Tax=Natranaerofaba carboxydovora TaxID=2742683 RepID=UPI001F13DB26|nr:MgtC/SapB family protein [Natranaerofaba carboxydovora]UMZ75339.1 MgtC family protein [Natranaerofaba carboxydovora]
MISELEIILRLILAGIAGGVIGFEREQHNRPAGFRTHILVCVGACLMTLVSIYSFDGPEGQIGRGADPARIASSIITGVGFLGAGTILRQGSTIRGLTTAASIWVVAGIGLAFGAGFYFGGTITLVIIVISLYSLGNVERVLARKRRFRELKIRVLDQPGMLAKITKILGDRGVNISNIWMSEAEFLEDYQAHVISIILHVRVPGKLNIDDLLHVVFHSEGVLELSWEGTDITAETLEFGLDLNNKKQ